MNGLELKLNWRGVAIIATCKMVLRSCNTTPESNYLETENRHHEMDAHVYTSWSFAMLSFCHAWRGVSLFSKGD
ncbi:hypothetical protein K450DRAFT_242487 [Umbelopsis ramanniana AG]|uniref:Uncharacterized protein n=1 Tax=Umbelopsis ramanniana AG TaxID=1314678 RepID=A0AAD5E8H8_UMBRA|nr:uncharacterized protein K450DRAFT_242487 [Umbelopsis ramanniana AG]KAI8579276.1 hypothetical protein K450DRAFT_242487 [Umbelopsis ramanniana AG]